jgi:hypothetical protein
MSGPLTDLADGLGRIVTALTTTLPDGTSVLRAGGAFDAAEIRRHITRAPAVIVTCLGAGDYARLPQGVWTVEAQLAAYVLCRDTPPTLTREVQALGLVTDVLHAVARATWNDPAAFGVVPGDSLDATNLYSGDLDAIAVALWAVTWRQTLIMDSG